MTILFALAAIPFALLGLLILWILLVWSVKLFGLFIKLICCLVGATVSVAVDAFHGAPTRQPGKSACGWKWRLPGGCCLIVDKIEITMEKAGKA